MQIEWKNPNREVIDGSSHIELNESNESITQRNLQKMDSEMLDVLAKESLGVNAGAHMLNDENCVCGGVRGYVKTDSGEIVTFGNIQDLDRSLVEGHAEFIVKIAIPMSAPKQIVEFVEREGFENLTPRAKDVIIKSVNTWNQK